MKRTTWTCLALVAIMLAAESAMAQNARWHMTLKSATKEAEETGKPIMMLFTGSDWCPGCINMRRNVFTQPAFRDWAEEKVVLLEVDFPRNKRQSAAVKSQNEELKAKYKPPHVPFVVFTDAAGNRIGDLGYGGQNAEGWTGMANGIIDRARAQAEAARAAALAKMAKRHQDLDEGLSTARAENRLVLVVFTGKDWSIPAKALEESVLSQDAFNNWAKETVVFVELDFPRNQELEESIKAKREALKEQYKVTRLPTALLLDQEGKELARQDVIRPNMPLEQWLAPIKKAAQENAPAPRPQPEPEAEAVVTEEVPAEPES